MMEAKKIFDKKGYRTVVLEGKKVRLRSTHIDHIITHATHSDRERFQGVVFEPSEPPHIFRRRIQDLIGSIESRKNALIEQYGRPQARSMPEFKKLNADLLGARESITLSKRHG